MCRLSRNLGASTTWNPKGLSRRVMGLLYLLPHIIKSDQIRQDEIGGQSSTHGIDDKCMQTFSWKALRNRSLGWQQHSLENNKNGSQVSRV
jgi:hypothetical protein